MEVTYSNFESVAKITMRVWYAVDWRTSLSVHRVPLPPSINVIIIIFRNSLKSFKIFGTSPATAQVTTTPKGINFTKHPDRSGGYPLEHTTLA